MTKKIPMQAPHARIPVELAYVRAPRYNYPPLNSDVRVTGQLHFACRTQVIDNSWSQLVRTRTDSSQSDPQGSTHGPPDSIAMTRAWHSHVTTPATITPAATASRASNRVRPVNHHAGVRATLRHAHVRVPRPVIASATSAL